MSKNETNKILCDAQKSRYVDSKDEYLCFTVARSSSPSPNTDVSVTIGLQIDASLRKKIKFLNDPNISEKEVGVTCQRCAIEDCKERVAPPIRLEERARRKKIQDSLQGLSEK